MKDPIGQVMEKYLSNREIAGAALIVRKRSGVVYKNKWGFSDLFGQKPVAYNSIFRMMSMTKCITAAAVMKLCEEGRLSLDDALSKYIPSFSGMRVVDDTRYVYTGKVRPLALLWKILTFRWERVKTVPADREITLRDLLSHSSGLQQGVAGMIAMMKDKRPKTTLAEQAEIYAKYSLDFQPGEGTSYSPVAAYDMLGRVIEIVSGKSVEEYMREAFFAPLDMQDTFFYPHSEDQKQRTVRVYKRKKEKLIDVTDTKEDMDSLLHRGTQGYMAGCGGLFSTVEDYDHFAEMLLNEGEYKGHRVLQKETVRLIHTEAPEKHLEPDPGCVWGLGVKIRQDPAKGNLPVTAGTYGWSGAFGTHFFVSPQDGLEAVFVTNRTDLEGSGSYISRKVEELIFQNFVEESRS